MPKPIEKSIDEHEIFLAEKLTPWSPQKRVALAAAVVERWLPAYESFSTEEEWGDPGALRRGLDAIWRHVGGHRLTPSDVTQLSAQVDEVTPHLDDFDAVEALIACAALMDALQACVEPTDSMFFALRAVLGVFEGLAAEETDEAAARARTWKRSAVRTELQAHVKLIETLDSLTRLDEAAIQAFRNNIGSVQRKGSSRPKTQAPAAVTNQMLFEIYRRMVESDLQRQVNPPPHIESSITFAVQYFSHWLARYMRRLHTINGSYGRLADEPGQRALLARNTARDSAANGLPAWDKPMREMVEMILANNRTLGVVDAGSIATPHAYGPSLRQLWSEAKRLGKSDEDAWRHIWDWGSHRPTAWDAETRRKQNGRAHSAPDLGEKLGRLLSWKAARDPEHPWETEVDGNVWRVRVNDFPDELMYSLIIGSANAGDFHDWPQTWLRADM